MSGNNTPPQPERSIPPFPGVREGSKQYQDMMFQKNFGEKIKIYNQLDKHILIKLLTEMENNYRKLSEQRNAELQQFAERISELQEQISDLQEKIGEK